MRVENEVGAIKRMWGEATWEETTLAAAYRRSQLRLPQERAMHARKKILSPSSVYLPSSRAIQAGMFQRRRIKTSGGRRVSGGSTACSEMMRSRSAEVRAGALADRPAALPTDEPGACGKYAWATIANAKAKPQVTMTMEYKEESKAASISKTARISCTKRTDGENENVQPGDPK